MCESVYFFLCYSICVKLIGFGSGLSNSTLGPSHHSTEDIGALNCLPNLTILSAATPREASLAIKEAYSIYGPVYVRIGLVGEQEIEEFTRDDIFQHNNIICEGSDGVIFSTGPIVSEVLLAANLLKAENMSLKVVNVNKIKPFCRNSFIKAVDEVKEIFTVEEHNVNGGLGSIVADFMVSEKVEASLTKIGLEDNFARGYGTQKDVQCQNGLDSLSIVSKVSKVLQRK